MKLLPQSSTHRRSVNVKTYSVKVVRPSCGTPDTNTQHGTAPPKVPQNGELPSFSPAGAADEQEDIICKVRILLKVPQLPQRTQRALYQGRDQLPYSVQSDVGSCLVPSYLVPFSGNYTEHNALQALHCAIQLAWAHSPILYSWFAPVHLAQQQLLTHTRNQFCKSWPT